MPSKKGGHVSTPKTYARSTKKAPVKKKTTTSQKLAGAAGAVVHANQQNRLPEPETPRQRAEYQRYYEEEARRRRINESRQVTSAEEYARRAAAKAAQKKTQQEASQRAASFVGRRAPTAARMVARTLSSAGSAGYQLGTTPNQSPAHVERTLGVANRRLAGSGYKVIRTASGGFKAVPTRSGDLSGKGRKKKK